jgi:pimeloyl-ACP methyl ester carboxylesterase
MHFHCSALAAWIIATAAAGAQSAPPAPSPGEAAFAVFLKGTQIGREQVSVSRTESGWIVSSTGRTAPPLDFTINRFELKYTTDWQPLELSLEARLRNAPVALKTSFGMTTAINEITQNNTTVSKEDQISARAIILPNNVFASYEVLAARLWTSAVDAELPLYVIPQAEIKLTVRAIAEQNLNGPTGSMATRRYDVTFHNPSGPLNAIIVVDTRMRLVRLEIPDAGLLVIREDASSVSMRAETARNPTDADVTISANGFNLAATLTTPPGVAGRLRYPAIVLIGGTSPSDRDEMIDGVPVFAQLAKELADSGHVVLRYDRRGTGQSGGRTETVTLADYADDAVVVVKWLARRHDVDGRRVVVVGHMDGGAVALLAATRAKEIDGVVTIDAGGSRGEELVLAQQQRVLERLALPAAERQARIDLQKKIHEAVLRGTGWEGVPAAMRQQADTPWFKSILTYDPAAVMRKVRQPILVVHGDLDPTVPPSEADKLGDLARARKKAPAPEVVHLPDISNTLAARDTKRVSSKVVLAISDWIRKL